MEPGEKFNNKFADQFIVEWADTGKEPTQKPNPHFPDGIEVKTEAPFKCRVTLKYPAPRVGHYQVECKLCGIRAAITTAGRRDDPKSLELPCKVKGNEGYYGWGKPQGVKGDG